MILKIIYGNMITGEVTQFPNSLILNENIKLTTSNTKNYGLQKWIDEVEKLKLLINQFNYNSNYNNRSFNHSRPFNNNIR